MSDELIRCQEHGAMFMGRQSGWCPSCEYDVDVEADVSLPGGRITDLEFRCRIEQESMNQLLPLMLNYQDDKDSVDNVSIGTVSWPKSEPLPAGFNKTEREFNIVMYQFGYKQKYIITNQRAKETIKSLRNGGYSDE